MPRHNIPDNEVWAWGGALEKPDSNRFEKGNESGQTAKPPKHTHFNWESKRADENMQYILRNATMPWDKDEKYPVGARVTRASKEYECIKESTNNDPATSSTYWEWIDNKHLPDATTTEKGVSRFATDDEAIKAVKDLIATNPSAVLALLKSRISDAANGDRSDYAASELAVSKKYDKTGGDVGGSVNITNSASGREFTATSADGIRAIFRPSGKRAFLGSYDIPNGKWLGYQMVGADGIKYSRDGKVEYDVFHEGNYQQKLPMKYMMDFADFLKNDDGLYTFTNSTGSVNFPAEFGGGIYFRRDKNPNVDGGWGLWANNETHGNKRPAFIFLNGTELVTDYIFTERYAPKVNQLNNRQGWFVHDRYYLNLENLTFNSLPLGTYTQKYSGNSTPERGYPIEEAGILDVSLTAGSRKTLIYKTFSTNRIFIANVNGDTPDAIPLAWNEIYSDANPPKVDEISGLEHIGKTAVGVSVQANDVAGESYQEFYDYGGDFFDLVSFDPSQYETHIYEPGYYLVDVIVMRGAIVGTPTGGINTTLKVNEVQYSNGFVSKDDATKRNPIQMKVVLKLNKGDKVRVYSDQDAKWQAGGSITFQYLRPLDATKDIDKPTKQPAKPRNPRSTT